jgi:hypothetical protein
VIAMATAPSRVTGRVVTCWCWTGGIR